MDYQDEYNQMMRDGNKNQQKFRYTMIAVLAFVIGFGLAWVSFKGQNTGSLAVKNDAGNKKETVVIGSKKNNTVANSGEEKKQGVKENPVASGRVSLAVLNQAPGKSVFVKELSSEQSLWVVIIEDLDGVHGNILGAGLFDTGETAGVVELLRGTVEGGTYYASLYGEDSDLSINRVFDLEKDLPLLDSDGNTIEVQFRTSSNPQ